MDRLLPRRAAVQADWVDGTTLLVLGVTGAFALLVGALLVHFCLRYRRARQPRPRQTAGNVRLELLWIGVPLLLSFALFASGAAAYVRIRRPPPDALPVTVEAKQWMFKFQHANGAREIDALHVPVGRPVRLTMTSQDVIHAFFVPAFRVKMDVLPGRSTTAWFEATRTGSFRLLCAEYCGTGHPRMGGFVHVLEPAEYEAWLAAAADGARAPRSPEEAGRRVFVTANCGACHGAVDTARGPGLAGVHGRRTRLEDGTVVVADDAYLWRAIVDPVAQVVAGWPATMPSYAGRLTERELLDLLAHLRALGAPEEP